MESLERIYDKIRDFSLEKNQEKYVLDKIDSLTFFSLLPKKIYDLSPSSSAMLVSAFLLTRFDLIWVNFPSFKSKNKSKIIVVIIVFSNESPKNSNLSLFLFEKDL